MDIFTAIILGFVQGIMEFLPVSANGHLILMGEIIDLEYINHLAVNGIFHLAVVFAIIVYFWNDIWILVQTLMRKMGRLPVNEKDLTLLTALLVAAIPAVIFGFLLEEILDKYLANTLVVALTLFGSVLFFIYAEWKYYTNPPHGEITINKGLKIGLFQLLALIPGFSRTGATIAGGMLVGLTRYESTRFSFLLAVPILFGFGVKKLLDLIVLDGDIDWVPIIIGSVVSFVFALFTIHFFLTFIKRYTLWPFIWYGLIVSGLTFYYLIYIQ